MSATATIISSGTDYAHRIEMGCHFLISDEPTTLGGQDKGPAPFDLYLASLASCTAITLRMYAQKKGWELGELRTRLSLSRDADNKLHVHREIWITGTLDETQWQRLIDVAAKTPVTRAMREGATITTTCGQ